MSFQENKRRERELKRELDQQDRRIAMSKRNGNIPPGPTAGSNEQVRESSEIKPEVIVKNDAVNNSPSTVVAIGEKQPVDPPFMYTRKGTLNTPQSD